ncbi:unnamed protein product [Cuscuta campestris]|uniref:CCHC-type domain-containing protein n=1 Tax=Cuscuta campestris TaxID=132261 RepID=A0A484M5B8_9ASTE|nr:unnamed protein product [Cuscuta campestris]
MNLEPIPEGIEEEIGTPVRCLTGLGHAGWGVTFWYLKTYESTILTPSLDEQKKKGIALKATKEPVEGASSDDDNELGLVIKKFHKFMKKEFERKGRKHDCPPKCYGCGEIGHIKPRCPKAKHGKDKPGFKKQRAYISWGGDSGDESTNQEGDEAANLCLMAHEDQSDDVQEVYFFIMGKDKNRAGASGKSKAKSRARTASTEERLYNGDGSYLWFDSEEERTRFLTFFSKRVVAPPWIIPERYPELQGYDDLDAQLHQADLWPFVSRARKEINPALIRVFYSNLRREGDVLYSLVKSTPIELSIEQLGRIAGLPYQGDDVSLYGGEDWVLNNEGLILNELGITELIRHASGRPTPLTPMAVFFSTSSPGSSNPGSTATPSCPARANLASIADSLNRLHFKVDGMDGYLERLDEAVQRQGHAMNAYFQRVNYVPPPYHGTFFGQMYGDEDEEDGSYAPSSSPDEDVFDDAVDDFFTLAPTVPITSSPQIGTLHFSSSLLNFPCIISVVYGLHTKEERRELWTTISNLAESTHSPWIMGGDFNAISSINQHKGKSSPCLASISEFDHCINSNGLIDPPYSGSPYTWLGNRSLGIVWRRLDRIFYNSAIQDLNLHINSQHLPRGNSDHSPILLKLLSLIFNGPSPFKFLNCWSSHHTFHPLILQNWGPYEGGGMRGLSQKLNNIRSILQHWNKSTFGNIFKDREHHENLLAEAEIAFTSDPSEENDNLLQQARCELNKLVAREYSYWKQKANLKWVKEGDLNTKFFHAFVRHRRMQQSIGSIKGKDNSWLTTWQDISDEALHFFNSLFTEEPSHPHAEFISNIPSLLTPADNNLLTSLLPSLEEVKEAVWDLNPDSSPGPDDISVSNGIMLSAAILRNGLGKFMAASTWKLCVTNPLEGEAMGLLLGLTWAKHFSENIWAHSDSEITVKVVSSIFHVPTAMKVPFPLRKTALATP